MRRLLIRLQPGKMSANVATVSESTVERLDVDNYATWKNRMKWLLLSKGLWGDSLTPDQDQKALAFIGLCVRDHHLPVLESCKTAKEAWDKLKAIFEAKSNARKRQLRKELAQLRMGAAEPLTKYVARAKEIQNMLRAVGHETADQEVAWALLAGLPPPYDTVVTVLETSTDADIKLDDILPKLMPVEQRMWQAEHPSTTEAALASKHAGGIRGRFKQSKETRTCYNCGEMGHIAKDCPNRRGKMRFGRPFSGIAL